MTSTALLDSRRRYRFDRRRPHPRRYRDVPERFVEGNSVTLLRDGSQALPSMLEAIEAGARQILLEMYWFGSDRVGTEFADALGRAARRGVQVAVLYDSVGSLETDASLFNGLRSAGCQVIEVNPLWPWHRRFRLDRLVWRDHRKLLVVDASVAFTGGVNLAEPWLPRTQGGLGWRDDMVCLKGPAVAELMESFLATWSQLGGAPLEAARPSDALQSAGSTRVAVLRNGFGRHRRQIIRAYVMHIYRARERVWIKNPYFVPDRRVVRALARAADRGVDVRILVPLHSDVPLLNAASRAQWSRLLRRGVRIFEWQGTMLHAKTAVIDRTWSTIGTFNLDFRSLLWNLEVNLAIDSQEIGHTMEMGFLHDLEGAREVDPIAFFGRSFVERGLEWLGYRFRRLL